jgi:hypothetical protein
LIIGTKPKATRAKPPTRLQGHVFIRIKFLVSGKYLTK